LLSGATHTQEPPQNAIDHQEKEEIVPDESRQNENIDINKHETDDTTQSSSENISQQKSRRVGDIIISGNTFTSHNAILNHIPYKIGETFDPSKTRTLIRNLYYNLKKFRTIKVMGEPINDAIINIHVIVEEKIPLAEIKTSGNKHVSDKEIAKKINIDEISAIDTEELKIIANKIK